MVLPRPQSTLLCHPSFPVPPNPSFSNRYPSLSSHPPWPWDSVASSSAPVLSYSSCFSVYAEVQTEFELITALETFQSFYFPAKDSELNLQFVPSFTFSPQLNCLCSKLKDHDEVKKKKNNENFIATVFHTHQVCFRV